jgi:iron(III) transport system substrate-binding protein
MDERVGSSGRCRWGIVGLALGLLALAAACGGGASSGGASPGGAAGGTSARNAAVYAGADRAQVLTAGAQQEGALVWYTSLTIGVAETLSRTFEAKYPGVKVELFRAADNDIITKVSEEGRAGKNIADLVEMPIPTLKVVKDAGLLGEYYLPNADSYPAEAKETGSGRNIFWAVDREHYISFGYNTNLVDPSLLPKDDAGLLAPGLKDQMALPGTTTGVNFLGYLLAHESPDFVTRLADQNVKVQMISGTALLDLIAKGEIAASPTVFQAEVLIGRSKGAPVEWIPIQPVTANAGAVGFIAQAPHPHAAALFAEFLLGDEGQQIFRDNYFGSAGVAPGFSRWYPDQGMTATQYEQRYEEWKKLLSEKFVRTN